MARSTGAEHQGNDHPKPEAPTAYTLYAASPRESANPGPSECRDARCATMLPSHQYRLPSRNPPCDQIGGTSGESANDESLQGAAKGGGSSESGFDEAENKERNKCDGNRKQESRVKLRSKYIRRKRNEASDNIGQGNGERAA